MASIPDLSPDEIHELRETRRALHRHPELGFEETRTAQLVVRRLEALGVTVQAGVARTGVVAVMEGREPGPCVMLRADMDALPIQEESSADYASERDGVMHACGHDCHVAGLLGVARLLERLGPLERGCVKFVFQPGEEGGGGALEMIEAGVLDDPPVDAVFGLHVWSALEAGTVAVVDGPFMGAVDRFVIRVRGVGGHGALPHETRDPVLAAAHVVTALQQIVSRNVPPLEGAVVSVGAIHGGDAFNVIPDEVVLEGTTRSFDAEVGRALPRQLERVACRTAEAFGCTATVEFQRLMQATVNDAAMAGLVRSVAGEVVGETNVVAVRTLTSEDFSEYVARVPGCFFFIGARNEAKGIVHPHHSPRFDVDESVLQLGVRLLAGTALRYLARGS